MTTINLANCGVLFNEATHTYTTSSGEILNGITHRLKQRVFPDEYKDVPKAVLERAARRGSIVHSCIELYDKFNIPTNDSQELTNYILASSQHPFLRNHLDSEYLITDGKQFASAIDKVYQDGDGVILADIKTTYLLNEEYVSWQLSVYAYFFSLANPDIEVKSLYALWFRDSKWRVVEVQRKPVELVKQMLYTNEPLIEFAPTDDTLRYPDINKAEESLVFFISQANFYADKVEEIRKGLLKLMTDNDMKKYDGSLVSITRKAEGEKKSFDSRAFKADHPELYEQYTRTSRTSPSLIIKQKS